MGNTDCMIDWLLSPAIVYFGVSLYSITMHFGILFFFWS